MEIDPTAATVHYKTAADFWELQAKILRDALLKAERRIAELEEQDAD